MRKYFYNPPKILKAMFTNTVWETNCGKLLLTFDDGPSDTTTNKILKKLDEHNIKALFFCVGEKLQKHPELTQQILDSGHTIGNHTWHHKRLRDYNREERYTGLLSFNKKFKENYYYDIKLFRPPYGRIFPYQTKKIGELGMTTVMWSLLTYDYQSNLDKVKFSIKHYLQSNSIVVMHDSKKTENIVEESIDYLVEVASNRNYKFGTPDECLK
ncbi:MAG: polysaccharide deacetylase family protein [Melioribacteraceae bacterium]|nr:polysaccharide deacetylase family protein [Melioribacteraceae bacterium]